MKKKIWIAITAIVLLLIGGEIYLRKAPRLCDTVLIQSDPDFEYIAQPNQNRYRFKKHVRYNEYSQRSESVDSSAFIILGLGDSVINGGVQTEQDSMATSRLNVSLSKLLGKKVQVLNISAGSWGPDNCEAYLKRYGMFGAKAAFLLCSSHDAHDNINHQPVVDVNPGFPSHQYKLAYWEVIHRYLLPRILKQEAPSEISKDGKVFNPGFQALADRFREAGIPFFIWLHPDRVEVEKEAYNQEGEEIIAFCQRDSIPLIEGLGVMSLMDYRDGIHVNEVGQRKISAGIEIFIDKL
ncbi:hypothetical protein [uncultured Parabacteroides sp.]|uniref:hypothetical protein n=1 Tax=uncultured Parabacteroides sp. TaxID=512312 RepID=UPI002806389F|nr:hypothetical protein [uncultured Parabacteroides sp.]